MKELTIVIVEENETQTQGKFNTYCISWHSHKGEHRGICSSSDFDFWNMLVFFKYEETRRTKKMDVQNLQVFSKDSNIFRLSKIYDENFCKFLESNNKKRSVSVPCKTDEFPEKEMPLMGKHYFCLWKNKLT